MFLFLNTETSFAIQDEAEYKAFVKRCLLQGSSYLIDLQKTRWQISCLNRRCQTSSAKYRRTGWNLKL